MQLVFEQVRVGGDRNFGYLLGDRNAGQAVLIDPSFSPKTLCERASAQKLKITHILNTHGHHDHTNGNEHAVQLTQAAVAAHPLAPTPPDLALVDGARLAVGSLSLEFLHTPGHCPDHLAIFLPQFQLALTGDLLFVGKVGGTQSDEDATLEWESLQRLLKYFPAETTLWPGHDYGCRPSSSLSLERFTNPFLLCPNLAAFLSLKRNWSSFKADHGLK